MLSLMEKMGMNSNVLSDRHTSFIFRWKITSAIGPPYEPLPLLSNGVQPDIRENSSTGLSFPPYL